MTIILPSEVSNKIIRALQKAKNQEIGGILMGELVDSNKFKIVDITIQKRRGTTFSFVRCVKYFIKPLNAFFNNTGHRYTKYNYLGEWHSHPLFTATPSSKDVATMFSIVCDKSVGANFAVLLVTKINENKLECSATFFFPDMTLYQGDIEFE